jgi:uncharacterized Zn finger protein
MREEVELLCPKCSSHRVVARTKDHNVLYLACDACGHALIHEEIGEQVARQITSRAGDRYSDLDFPEGGG